nr:SIS domain-containing protein [Desulfobacterales bacterium]
MLKNFEESINLKKRFAERYSDALLVAARVIADSFSSGHKLLLFGNGGSAADAQHIAAEFVNRFTLERKPLPAIALTTDSSILTSIGNDYSVDEIFSKQIRALGNKGDVAWGISTSGNSKNVVQALMTAADMGIYTLALTGGNGGELIHHAKLSLIAESYNTARIQETHITAGHVICELVERLLFPGEF